MEEHEEDYNQMNILKDDSDTDNTNINSKEL